MGTQRTGSSAILFLSFCHADKSADWQSVGVVTVLFQFLSYFVCIAAINDTISKPKVVFNIYLNLGISILAKYLMATMLRECHSLLKCYEIKLRRETEKRKPTQQYNKPQKLKSGYQL